MKQDKRKRGRPTKTAPARGGASLGGRVSATLKRRLDESADRNGRTQSRELEMRLDQSFKTEDRLGGPDLAAIVNLMAGAFALGGRQQADFAGHSDWPAARWVRDQECYMAATEAVIKVLEEFCPQGNAAEAEEVREKGRQIRQVGKEENAA